MCIRDRYVYVNGVVSTTGFSKDYQADAYFADGTNATIDIDTLYTWDGSKYVKENLANNSNVGAIDNGNESHGLYGWYSFSTNSDDEYTLRAIKRCV